MIKNSTTNHARVSVADFVRPLLIATVVYVLLLFTLLRSFGFNPTGPIRIGSDFDGARFWSESTLVQEGIGYDGQFFYYLALDPSLQANDPEAFLDRPAYRYARVLYPAFAWMAALGQPGIVPWSLLLVNVLAALLGTVACMDILRSIGARVWWALGFAFSPAILIGLVADLAEPTSFALVALGIALYLRGLHRSAGLTLALSALAREASLLVPLGFAIHAGLERRWRQALAYLIPLALPLLWHIYIWNRFGVLPSAQAPSNFGLPFSGAIYRASLLLGLQPPLLGEPVPDFSPSELAMIVISVLIVLVGLLKILTRRDVFTFQLWLQAAAAICTSPLVWIGLSSYGRVLGLLYLFYGLTLLTGRKAAATESSQTRSFPFCRSGPLANARGSDPDEHSQARLAG